MRVWVVMRCSDFETDVVGVFSTLEKAQRAWHSDLHEWNRLNQGSPDDQGYERTNADGWTYTAIDPYVLDTDDPERPF